MILPHRPGTSSVVGRHQWYIRQYNQNYYQCIFVYSIEGYIGETTGSLPTTYLPRLLGKYSYCTFLLGVVFTFPSLSIVGMYYMDSSCACVAYTSSPRFQSSTLKPLGVRIVAGPQPVSDSLHWAATIPQ